MNYKTLPLTLGLALAPLTAYSLEINFSGFMSIVGGMTLDSDTTYDVGFTGYNGVYDDEFSISPDSMFGLQAQVVGDEKLSATIQMIGRGGNSFDVETEWAYVSYKLTDSLTVNAGRSRLPIFYYSDFLDVGYAYHWIRAPDMLYSGPSYYDGANLYYSNYFGDFEVTGQIYYGNWAEDYDSLDIGPISQEITNITGISILLGTDLLKFRATRATADNLIVTSLPGLPPTIESDNVFTGFALMSDFKNFIFRSEFTELELDDQDARTNYASLGYTFNNVTPHITYSDTEELIGLSVAQESLTYGVAWNFNPSGVFKVEFQNNEFESNPALDSDLLTFGIDLVF